MSQVAPARKIQPEPARKSGWSPERRAKQAARIKIWAPWARSTGPKTPSGKKKSALNAYKHGNRARDVRMVNRAFRLHSRFLRNVNTLITLKKRGVTNELLEPVVQKTGWQGLMAAAMLDYALRKAGFARFRP